MPLVANQNHFLALAVIFLGLIVYLGDQRADGVDDL